MKNIFVYGSINVDLVYELDAWPKTGETLLAKDFSTYFGGKGANQAVSAARLGGRVHMIGNVGRDPYGQKMIDDLKSENVDVSKIDRSSEHSGSAVILLCEEDNRIILNPGANLDSSLETFRMVLSDQARPEDIVLFQFEKDDQDVEEAVRLAKKHRAFVICNPAPMKRELVGCIDDDVDLWIMNESEASFIQGDVFDPKTFLDGYEDMRVILTLGSSGSMTKTNGRIVSVDPYAVSRIVDTTGAGDTYIGTVAFYLSVGFSLPDAMIRASVAAGLSIGKKGARTGMPTRDELERTINHEENEA